MVPTTRENEEFISSAAGAVLDEAVEWVSKNMMPEHVFLQVELEEWAKDTGYLKEAEG